MNTQITKYTDLSACVANLVSILFPMSLTDEGKVQETFEFTEMLSKSQNAALTQLKKRGLLTSEILKDDEGKKLLIHLTENGMALFTDMQGIPQDTEETDASDEDAEVSASDEVEEVNSEEDLEESSDNDEEDDEDFEPLVIKDDVRPAPVAPVTRNLAGVMGIFDALPEAGTVLTKVYKGTSYFATLAADGSCTLNDGREFTSLTAAARFITGAKNISGRKFFGCAGKRVAKSEEATAIA